MSRERDKLIAILNELEKDYHEGNISQEKYISLRKRYIHKIDTLDASNRVRAMRGKSSHSNNHSGREGSPKGYNSKRNNPRYNKHPKQGRNPNYRQSRPKGYYDENGEFHPYKSGPYNERNLNNVNTPVNDVPKETKSKTSVALVALFTIILLAAFGTGIFMGVFGDGFSFGFDDLLGAGAAINDTAFPIQDQTVNLTDYSSNSSDISSNYSSTSSDYSSYSSSDDSSSGGYDDSGSGSGGYDDSGSSSGSGSYEGSGSESN